MDTIVQILNDLLITPPGNLLYHLVLLFSIIAAFQSLLAVRNEQKNFIFQKLALILGLLFVIQSVLFLFSMVSWIGTFPFFYYLPALNRSAVIFSLLLIGYIWCFPQTSKPVTLALIIISIAAIAYFLFSIYTWNPLLSFNQTWLSLVWTASAIVISLAAILILAIRKPDKWVIGIIFFIINLTASLVNLLWPMPQENYSAAMRFGLLCSFPILPAMVTFFIPKPSPEQTSSIEKIRKKYEANKRIIASLTNELEAAQTQILKLNNEKEESREKFQQLSQDILFLSSQINFNDQQLSDVHAISSSPSVEVEGVGVGVGESEREERKGDQVLRVWIEQIQKDNEELNQENKKLLQKNLSLTAKIKQFQWDQEIDTDELESIQHDNKTIDDLLDSLSQEIIQIDQMINEHFHKSNEAKNLNQASKQYAHTIKDIHDAFHTFLDPQAAIAPLEASYESSGNNANIDSLFKEDQRPVEAFEAELELLLGDSDNTSSEASKSGMAKDKELGLPQFMKDVPYREKTQPVKIKKKNAEGQGEQQITETSTPAINESIDIENRKQINELFKRLRVQGIDHRNQRVGEIVPYLTPLFKNAQNALSFLVGFNNESEEIASRQKAISAGIQNKIESLENKLADLSQSVQENSQDISTAKRISSELKFKNEQLRNTIQKAKDAQLQAEEIADEQLNENSNLRTANEKYEKEISEYNKKIEEFKTLQSQLEEKLETAESALNQMSTNNEELNNRLKTIVKDIQDSPGKIANLETSLSDMKQKAEMMSDETTKIKQENLETISQIVELSNEISQPVTSIQGYTDLLLSETVGKLGAAHLKFAELIRSSAQRLSDLLNELNELVKDQQGSDIIPQSIDLAPVIEAALQETSIQRSDKNLTVNTNTPDGLGPLLLEQDLFKQVLIQTLDHAYAISPENGQVDINIQLESEADDQYRSLLIKVTDQGKRYSQDELDLLFNTQEEQDVDNIGLSIARTLIESQKGKIWAESTTSQGKTIHILLPVQQIA